jgi:hypothetical protein
LTVEGLLHELKAVKKEKAWKVLQFLQSENKLTTDEKGFLVNIG